jgi:protein phosphatase
LVAAVCQGNEKHTRSMVAGALALTTLHAHLCGTKRTVDLKADLLAAMTEAHSRIFRESSAVATGLRGIGASVTVVAIQGTQLAAAHVGEGAAFLRRDGHVERLTAIHAGVDAAEAREALRAHPDLAEGLQWMVWKVLGVTERPSFDLFVRDIEPGDLVVLATSLPALVAPQVLNEAQGPAEAVSAALRAATPLAETPNIATSVVIRRSGSG